jgi:hypothetical protein
LALRNTISEVDVHSIDTAFDFGADDRFIEWIQSSDGLDHSLNFTRHDGRDADLYRTGLLFGLDRLLPRTG